MATNTPAETQAAHDRWERMWSHREHLLKVARRRSMSPEDAEDAVHEAMLRAAERPDLDDERLAAWLTTVTIRLCVDRYRQVNREAEVRTSPTLIAPGPVPVEEAVCDRAEARWLAARSGELPARQAEAIWLKSEDLDVGQVAGKMGLSYRTVESLLARARRTLRDSLAGTLGLAVFLWGRGRPRGASQTQAVALAGTAATLAVAGFVLPYADDWNGESARPRTSVSPVPEAWQRPSADVREGRGASSPGRPAASASGAPGASRTPADRSLLPLSVPSLPGVPAGAELSVPGVSAVPALPELPSVPADPVPGLVPDRPSLPEAPDTPEAPRAPQAPQAPRVPAVPEPTVADAPDAPVGSLP
ncbi:sigma-70 family RNA polymerase sigma factor [Streptomyces spinoverrucosus]|uniref:RNA polymerase sigma factor n=1 Tax=Streptomyces spinoverrucosus TaxID=284043 RepID=UPI0018C417CE|nr:sigma-70 family RNA polymerase sigma factor [Streptomyces spinoverrucosus]MBG0851480.1 sigma-70 family RNA polymerase sigma factor [Streptomyces spinoverrucosus]